MHVKYTQKSKSISYLSRTEKYLFENGGRVGVRAPSRHTSVSHNVRPMIIKNMFVYFYEHPDPSTKRKTKMKNAQKENKNVMKM